MSVEITGASGPDRQVDRVVELFFRILRGCNVRTDELSTAVGKALESFGDEDLAVSLAASPEQHLACTNIVFAWRHAPPFVDVRGAPQILPILGQNPSFESLCAQFAPEYEPIVLLEYLQALSAIRRAGTDRIALATESVLACGAAGARTIAPRTVLLHLQGFLGSVEFNLTRPPSQDPGRFERACYAMIPKELFPVFERLVEVRGQNFVDSIDEWLERHRPPRVSPGQCLVGAGAYVFAHSSNTAEVS